MNALKDSPEVPTLDVIEATMADMPQAACPVEHRFTPGLYIREITMPAGTLVTSMVHKKRHPFVISKGKVRVISETEGAVVYTAPHTGITEPGTRRLLHVMEETVWTTFHVTELVDVEEIAKEMVEHSPNKLIDGKDPRLNHWRGNALGNEETES